MITETIDGDRIEERIENPQPKHLLRLRDGDTVRVRTESHSFLGYVTDEGELEEWVGGETSINVNVHVPTQSGMGQYASLIYYSDSRGEGLVLNVLGEDGGREELELLEVVSDE